MNVNDLFGKFNVEKKKDSDINRDGSSAKGEKRSMKESLNSELANKKQKQESGDTSTDIGKVSLTNTKNDPIYGFQVFLNNPEIKVTDKMKTKAAQFCEKEPPKSDKDFVDYGAFNNWCSELNSNLWNAYISNMRAHQILKDLTIDSKNDDSSSRKKREKFLVQELLPNEELLYNLISKIDDIKNFEAAYTKNSENSDNNMVLFYQSLLNPENQDGVSDNTTKHSLFDLLLAIFKEHESTDIKYLVLQKLHLMVNDFENSEDNPMKDWQLLIFAKFFALGIPQAVNVVYEQLNVSTEKILEGTKTEIDDFKFLIAEFYTSLISILDSNKTKDADFVGLSADGLFSQINYMNDWFLKLRVFVFERKGEINEDDTFMWYEYFDLLFTKIDIFEDESSAVKVFDNLNMKIDEFDSLLEFLVVKFSKFKNPKKLKKLIGNSGNLEDLEKFQILVSLILKLIDTYTFLKLEFVDKIQGLQLMMIFFRNYFNKDNFKEKVESSIENIESTEEFDSMEWQKCLKFILPLLFQIVCTILSRDVINGELRRKDGSEQETEKLEEESLRILDYCTLSVQCGLLKYLFKPLSDITIVSENEEAETGDQDMVKEILCTVLFPLRSIFTKSVDSTKRFDILQFYKYWISIIVSLLNNLQFDSEERVRLTRKLFKPDVKMAQESRVSYYDKILMIKTFINSRIAKKYRSKYAKNIDEEIRDNTDMQDYIVTDSYLFKIDYGFDIIKLIAMIQSWYLIDCDVTDENSEAAHLRLLELKQFKAELEVSDSYHTYLDIIDSFLDS